MAGEFADAEEQEGKRRQALIEQLYVLGEIVSTENAHFHQMAAASYGLGATDMKALSALLQEGPMTAGQLVKRLNLTTGAITNVIDRLERRDLARRVADPNDRRKVIVTVNTAKLAAGENVYLSIGAAFSRMYATYSTEQLEFLARYQQDSIALIRQETEKLTGMRPENL